MLRSSRLAAHEVRMGPDGRLFTESGVFDEIAYSEMKYGHAAPARYYGYRLAELLTADDPLLLLDPDRKVVVYGPATWCTPKPAYAIAFYFTQMLNLLRTPRELPPAQLHDMRHLRQGSPVPYACLDLDGRRTAMSFTVDYADPTIVDGAHIVVIDDAIVTGTVEAKMTEVLAPLHPAEIRYLYGIRLDPDLAAADPQAEDRINSACNPTPATVADFIARGEFILNDRTLRMLLTWPDRGDLHALLKDLSSLWLDQLLSELGAGSTAYSKADVHLLGCLHQILQERAHPLAAALDRAEFREAARTR